MNMTWPSFPRAMKGFLEENVTFVKNNILKHGQSECTNFKFIPNDKSSSCTSSCRWGLPLVKLLLIRKGGPVLLRGPNKNGLKKKKKKWHQNLFHGRCMKHTRTNTGKKKKVKEHYYIYTLIYNVSFFFLLYIYFKGPYGGLLASGLQIFLFVFSTQN